MNLSSQPLLSIITPTYNGGNFIESCVLNVAQQGHPALEHIIVDGDSQDSTIETLTTLAKKYPHLRWISEKDSGQSNAMNKGIRMASGKIIGILNVDDYYEEKILQRVTSLFENSKDPSLLVGNCNIWDNSGNLKYYNAPQNLSFVDLISGVFTFPANPSAYFYHLSLHEQVGDYDENDHYSMDLDFLMRAVQIAHVKYFNETWGNFRMLEDTKTVQDMKSGQIESRIKTLRNRYEKNLSSFQKLQVKFIRERARVLNSVTQYLHKYRVRHRLKSLLLKK